jgi:transposase
MVVHPCKAASEIRQSHQRSPLYRISHQLSRRLPAGLTRFCDDSRIPLDNNASERQVRGPALGRKNYYGSGALWSGRLAATLFSLFATLRMAKINIRTWLTQFLESCAENGGSVPSDIEPFLPWKMSEQRHREMALDPDESS